MFGNKNKVVLLNSKWETIISTKLGIIPRKDEYIFLNDAYYEVLNVIHRLGKTDEIFLVIEKIPDNIHVKSVKIKKNEK